MTIGKKTKRLIKVVILLVLLAIVYRANPYQIEFMGHYDKIWAHRVNSLDKLAWATPFFKGVELDLVYNNGVFDVTHPPTESIGLTFGEYLSQLTPSDSMGVWLDIKNLSVHNATEILKSLKEILETTKYPKSSLLIETRDPLALSDFMQDGFRSSYYLPYGLHEMSAADLSKNIVQIREVLETYPTLEISSHFKDYELMREHFKAEQNLWITRYSRIKDYKTIRALLFDPNVKTVLIPYRAVQGNR